jgi:hypothetical protein
MMRKLFHRRFFLARQVALKDFLGTFEDRQ